ncbi:MAG TPA: SPOR domain-containing protein [Candidatus Limnocylindria bacterium]|nr:SPOR domain-containing protein [Candidatus Limnocylindria bacterium]
MESEADLKEWSPKGPSPWPWVILAVIVVAGAAFGFVTMRSGAEKRKAAEQVEAARAAAAESLATAALAESLRAVTDTTASRAAGPTATATPPATGAPGSSAAPKPAPAPTRPTTPSGPAASRPTSPPAGTAGGGSAAPAPAGGPFGLVIGEYLFEDRATSERDRLATSTGLSGKVAPATKEGTTVYRVILGSFGSRAEAERKAAELTGQSVVSEARVVPLPK